MISFDTEGNTPTGETRRWYGDGNSALILSNGWYARGSYSSDASCGIFAFSGGGAGSATINGGAFNSRSSRAVLVLP